MTDATGALMTGVAVSLERDAVPPLKAITNDVGDYLFADVSPGTYRMTFFQDGFKKTVRMNVLVPAGWQQRVDQRMEVGSPVTFDQPAQGVLPTVAYRPVRTASSFTKDIVTATGRPVPLRPCKIEKY